MLSLISVLVACDGAYQGDGLSVSDKGLVSEAPERASEGIGEVYLELFGDLPTENAIISFDKAELVEGAVLDLHHAQLGDASIEILQARALDKEDFLAAGDKDGSEAWGLLAQEGSTPFVFIAEAGGLTAGGILAVHGDGGGSLAFFDYTLGVLTPCQEADVNPRERLVNPGFSWPPAPADWSDDKKKDWERLGEEWEAAQDDFYEEADEAWEQREEDRDRAMDLAAPGGGALFGTSMGAISGARALASLNPVGLGLTAVSLLAQVVMVPFRIQASSDALNQADEDYCERIRNARRRMEERTTAAGQEFNDRHP